MKTKVRIQLALIVGPGLGTFVNVYSRVRFTSSIDEGSIEDSCAMHNYDYGTVQ